MEALKRANGNKSQAARLLGLSRNALRYRLGKLGVVPAGIYREVYLAPEMSLASGPLCSLAPNTSQQVRGKRKIMLDVI